MFGHTTEAALLAERIATRGNQVGVGMIITLPDINIARFGERPALRKAFRGSTWVSGGEDALEILFEGDTN